MNDRPRPTLTGASRLAPHPCWAALLRWSGLGSTVAGSCGERALAVMRAQCVGREARAPYSPALFGCGLRADVITPIDAIHFFYFSFETISAERSRVWALSGNQCVAIARRGKQNAFCAFDALENDRAVEDSASSQCGGRKTACYSRNYGPRGILGLGSRWRSGFATGAHASAREQFAY